MELLVVIGIETVLFFPGIGHAVFVGIIRRFEGF